MDNNINKSHYEKMKIQPIEFIHQNKLDWFQGEAIKYICRWKDKNGVEDLRKARDILDQYISNVVKEHNANNFGQIQWKDPRINSPIADIGKLFYGTSK